MPASAGFRLPRAGVFATVCVSVSVGGHAAASDTPVPVLGVVAGFLLVLGMAWGATIRECRYGTVLAWMLWGQLALHLVFHRAQRLSSVSEPEEPSPAHLARHPPATGGEADGSPVLMLLAHIAAAMVTAWWLRRGEAAAFALARALRMLLTPPLVQPRLSPCTPAPVVVPAATADSPALYGTVLPYVRTLRGPPLRTGTR